MLLDYIKSLPVYHELQTVGASGEGNLLEVTDTKTAESQVAFFIWAFSHCEVLDVLEIGTNRGFFGLLLSILRPGSYLTTMDVNPGSFSAAQILLEKTSLDDVAFLEGDSKGILPTFGTVSYNFAWVDGHHGYDWALSDLLQCSRLEITYIALDDTNMDTVKNAMLKFLETEPYKELPNPFIANDVRKARLFQRV